MEERKIIAFQINGFEYEAYMNSYSESRVFEIRYIIN